MAKPVITDQMVERAMRETGLDQRSGAKIDDRRSLISYQCCSWSRSAECGL